MTPAAFLFCYDAREVVMNELVAFLLFLIWLPGLRSSIRVGQAKADNDRARDALNAWIASHPDCSLSSSQAKALIRERLLAWRAYVKVCPPLDDWGVLERYLEGCLEDLGPAPYPMP